MLVCRRAWFALCTVEFVFPYTVTSTSPHASGVLAVRASIASLTIAHTVACECPFSVAWRLYQTTNCSVCVCVMFSPSPHHASILRVCQVNTSASIHASILRASPSKHKCFNTRKHTQSIAKSDTRQIDMDSRLPCQTPAKSTWIPAFHVRHSKVSSNFTHLRVSR